MILRALMTALSLAMTCHAALALDESHAADTIRALLLSPPACPETGHPVWQRETVTNPMDGYRLRLSRFGCETSAKGAVMIVPGRTESSPEYAETALDLIARGFGPVFVIDHRGQGLSPRLLPDPLAGHVDRFEDYVIDMETAVAHARGVIGDDTPLHLLASSMGGAIMTGYLQQEGADAPVSSAVMLGGMIRVNYFSFIDRPATWANLQIYAETGAYLQARLQCDLLRKCTDYAVAEPGPVVIPQARAFTRDTPDLMTHSAERFALRDWIWSGIDWAALTAGEYAESEIWEGPAVGPSTVQWVREAARFNREMRQPRHLARMTHVPLLMITGTEDLRAYRQHPEATGRDPDLYWHERFCAGINTIATAERRGITCTFVPAAGAYHELLKESDAYRDPVLKAITAFFAASTGEDVSLNPSGAFPADSAATMSLPHGQTEIRPEL